MHVDAAAAAVLLKHGVNLTVPGQHGDWTEADAPAAGCFQIVPLAARAHSAQIALHLKNAVPTDREQAKIGPCQR